MMLLLSHYYSSPINIFQLVLEGMMWILRKNHECLSEANKASLELLYKHSPKLKEAHTYALKLTHIFNTHVNTRLWQS